MHISILTTLLISVGRLRFPRVTLEPPRLRLRGLTLATSPAGVFVFHSNQKLKHAEKNLNLIFQNNKIRTNKKYN
ncbi:hypothetical protein GA0061094_2274 [[Bacillus] enclensis]|uniref:Uncharacterized protein n=1 Tax=[Bacillus] enclensis TaxID=1402860 RepID=A0A1C4BK06_9BACI|nr:hypothetical protein GA0061094_2274 [[Bacillus] enclensis]